MAGKRVRTIVFVALVAIAAVVLVPRAVHAYRVHEAKVWCEELSRQIRTKYGDRPPRGEGPWRTNPPHEFEPTMPRPPALIGDFNGVSYESWEEGFHIEFRWKPSLWTDSPLDPHNQPGCNMGWSFDSPTEEWS